ncbi:MAG: replicative DNA helicase [Candidatus Nanopelagicales bacterium]
MASEHEPILPDDGLPKDQEAERQVVGAILNAEQRMGDVVLELRPEDFHFWPERAVFEAMANLYDLGDPINVTTIQHAMGTKRTQQIGGATYLADLLAEGSVRSLDHNVRAVRNFSMLRATIRAAQDTLKLCREDAADAPGVLDEAGSRIMAIGTGRGGDVVRVDTRIPAWWEGIKAAHEPGGRAGVLSGVVDLDRITTGFRPGEMTIVAGATSHGKTSFALQVAENVMRQGEDVLVFSIEMSLASLIARSVGAAAGVSPIMLSGGHLGALGLERAERAVESMAEWASHYHVCDKADVSVREMRSLARSTMHAHGLALVVVDYLQIAHGDGQGHSRQEEVAYISSALRAMARELNVPVLALSQLSRAYAQRGENAEPRLSDLRDSGAIEQDADLVLFVHRPRKGNENGSRASEAVLILGKHRNGPLGRVECWFMAEEMRFAAKDVREIPPAQEESGRMGYWR